MLLRALGILTVSVCATAAQADEVTIYEAPSGSAYSYIYRSPAPAYTPDPPTVYERVQADHHFRVIEEGNRAISENQRATFDAAREDHARWNGLMDHMRQEERARETERDRDLQNTMRRLEADTESKTRRFDLCSRYYGVGTDATTSCMENVDRDANYEPKPDEEYSNSEPADDYDYTS